MKKIIFYQKIICTKTALSGLLIASSALLLTGCGSTGHYGRTHHYNNVWKKDIQSSSGRQVSKRNWGIEEPLPMDPSSNVNPRRVFRRAPTLAEPNI